MKLWMRLLPQIGLALVLTANLAPGYAAEAHMYRCVNAKGRVYYSDVPGAECAQGRHDRLTRDGIVLDRPVDEAELEAAAISEAKAAAEQKRKLLAQNRHDSMLLATYASEEQIETAKQRRLKTPLLSLELSMKKIGIYRTRLIELKQREAALADSNKPIPASLTKDVKAAESDIARIAEEIETKKSSLDQIVGRFDDDKARYRELTVPTRKP
jgi:hypothetical protein